MNNSTKRDTLIKCLHGQQNLLHQNATRLHSTEARRYLSALRPALKVDKEGALLCICCAWQDDVSPLGSSVTMVALHNDIVTLTAATLAKQILSRLRHAY